MTAVRWVRAGVSTRFAAFAPVLAIVAVQLVLFPVPSGVWIRGIIVGGLTALIALGMALVHQTNRVVSFAQADLGMAPVVLTTLLITVWGWPWLVAVPVGLAAATALGAVVELVVIRRFRDAPRLLLTVATLGLAQVLAGLALLLPRLFGVTLLGPRLSPPFSARVEVGGTIFGPNDVLALVAIPVAVAGLALFLRRTDVGLGARAVADRVERAALLGVPVGRIQTTVWALVGMLAFVAVLLRAGVLGLPVGAALSLGILLRALAALLIGRFTNLPVIAAAAVALGVLEIGVAWHASSPAMVDPVLAAVIIASLLLRRRTAGRGDSAETSSWRASDDPRPVPSVLRRLAVVRGVWFGGSAVVVAAAFALPHLLSVDRSLKASALLVYALLGCSIVVLTGWAGLVSLGQVALFALGAALGATATATWGLDLLLALPLTALAGAAAAVAVGFPAARLRGVELGVVTLAAALAATSWLLNPRFFDWVPTRRVPRPALLGRIDIDSPTRIYTLILVVLLLVLVGLAGVRGSRTGRALLAVRDNERGAQAYGLSVVRLRLTAFALSGGIAGLAGCLFAHHQQAFGQQPYLPEQNLAVFTMVVLGGIGAPVGAVLGALWLQGTRWFLPGEWQLLASGVGVLLVLMLVPGGLGGLALRLRDRWLSLVARRHHLAVAGYTTVAADDPVDPVGSADPAQGGTRDHPPARPRPDAADGAGGRADSTRGTDRGDGTALTDRANGSTGRTDGTVRTRAPAGPSDRLLRVEGLEAGYDGVPVLHGIDLDVAAGEVVAVLGTNGAGKSTLLRAIAGSVAPLRGTVQLDGLDITRSRPHRIAALGVSLMPGGAGVFPSLSVEENLRLAVWLRRRERAEADRRVAGALAPFPALERRRRDLAGDLSGGQQQQLALAMALLTEPRLLLVDELSLGLAPIVVAELLPLVERARQGGTTVVLVEQSVEIALAVADRAVFIEKGRVRFAGTTADLRDRTDLLRAVFLPTGGSTGPTSTPAPGPRYVEPRRDEAPPPAPTGSGARGAALRAESLSVAFGGIQAVDRVSLEVAPGEIVGIIGPNGAGKTTLFDLLSGYEAPTTGRLWLSEHDVTTVSSSQRARAGLGRSFQDARLFPALTVEEAVALACERWVAVRDPLSAALRLPHAYDSERRVQARTTELVDLLGLGPHRSNLIRELSTGTRRIVDLACLLAHRPTVILLDEPSSGIAQREVEALAPLLEQIRTATGASLLVVEHDIPLVRTVADRLVAMDQGRVIADGPPLEVLAHPRVVAAYLGPDSVTIERSGTATPTATRPAP